MEVEKNINCVFLNLEPTNIEGQEKTEPKKFSVSKEIIVKYSSVIKNQLDDLEGDSQQEFPISNKFTEQQIQWFIDYINHHGLDNKAKPIPKPLPSSQLKLYISEWDYQFISQFDEIKLVDLIQIANFLDCPDILELGYAKVASIFLGKTLEELKQEYNITEDLTPEVEQQIKKEHTVNIYKGTAFERLSEKERAQQQQQLSMSQQKPSNQNYQQPQNNN